MLEFVLVLGHPVVIRFPGALQRFVDEAIERGHYVVGGELHNRFAAGLVLAGQQEAVRASSRPGRNRPRMACTLSCAALQSVRILLPVQSEHQRKLQVSFINEIPVGPQPRGERPLDIIVDTAVHVSLAETGRHRAAVFRHRIQKPACRRLLDVDGGKLLSHQVATAVRVLPGKLRVQQFENVHYPRRSRFENTLPVAVLFAQKRVKPPLGAVWRQ